MIQANEVRIGNVVIGYKNHEPFIITAHDFYRLIEYGIDFNELVKGGVKLTPDILKSCGFIFHEDKTQVDGIKGRLNTDSESVWFSTCGTLDGGIVVLCLCKGNYFAPNIEHLHDLQNIFYYVTGKELTITL